MSDRNLVVTLVLTFVAVFGIYMASVASTLLAYSPSKAAVYILKYGLFVLLICSYAYLIFFGRTKWINGKTVWQKLSNVGKIQQVVFVPLFLFMVVFFLQRCMAYPTKWLAGSYVSEEMRCVHEGKLGRTYRNRVNIEVVSFDGKNTLIFPWPADHSPNCPSLVKIEGYEWFWGTYIIDVGNI